MTKFPTTPNFKINNRASETPVVNRSEAETLANAGTSEGVKKEREKRRGMYPKVENNLLAFATKKAVKKSDEADAHPGSYLFHDDAMKAHLSAAEHYKNEIHDNHGLSGGSNSAASHDNHSAMTKSHFKAAQAHIGEMAKCN